MHKKDNPVLLYNSMLTDLACSTSRIQTHALASLWARPSRTPQSHRPRWASQRRRGLRGTGAISRVSWLFSSDWVSPRHWESDSSELLLSSRHSQQNLELLDLAKHSQNIHQTFKTPFILVRVNFNFIKTYLTSSHWTCTRSEAKSFSLSFSEHSTQL